MAFLYIDRLKSDFQTSDPFVPSKVVRVTWYPWFFVKLFGDRDREDCSNLKECRAENISVNFVPRTPKIATIGLRLDYNNQNANDDARQFWGIADIKNYLKQYFNVLLRYQNFLCVSWKSDCSENSNETSVFSFASFTSLITKYTRKVIDRRDDKQSSEIDLPPKLLWQRDTKEESYFQANFTTIQINESRHFVYRPNNQMKPMKNVAVQTLDRRKIRHRKPKKTIQDETENKKDSSVKTIFRTGFSDFNKKNNKTDLECDETPTRSRKSKSSRKNSTKKGNVLRSENTFKDSKLQTRTNTESPKEEIFRRRYVDRIKSESLVIFRDKHDCYEPKTRSTNEIYDVKSSKAWNGWQYHFGGGGETIESKGASAEIGSRRYSCGSRGFVVEDKTSEIMILGNVKKRLEKDFDDYFSMNEYDFQNTEDIEINENSSNDELKARSMLTTTSLNILEDSEEGRKQSIRTSLTRTSSIRFSNLDPSRSQSSYHTSFREQQCSPSSSIEYCTASNVSLTKMRRCSQKNSFDTMLRSCTMADNFKLPSGNLSPNGSSVEENEVFQNSRVFFDGGALVHYQRNSTPKLESSSKRIMESLDSGILADFSRDHVRTMSRDRLNGENWRENEEEGNRPDGESDLLPTYDFNTDTSYSDESLDRRVDLAIEQFTEQLILAERRARMKLRKLEEPTRRRRERKRKSGRQVKEPSDRIPKRNSTCEFESSLWLNDDDWISSTSTPPFYSFSDSEIDHL